MLVTPEDNVFLCKYMVKRFQVVNKDITLDMGPDNVLSLEFINDYENNMFAILKVVLKVDVRKKIYMYNNKWNLNVTMELEKVGYDVNVEYSVTNPENVFNLVFVPYFNDDADQTDAASIDARLAQNDVLMTSEKTVNDENYFETQNTVDMYLFNQQLLKASRYTFNKVFTQTTIQNMLGRMLTESKHPKVLMSRIENTELYKEMLLLPNPVYKNIMYLDQYYGLYEKGACVFYDLDCLYIINANGKLTAKRKNEWTETVILVSEIATAVPGQGMLRKPGESINYCVVSEMEVNPQKGSILQDASIGANVKIAFTDGTEMKSFKSGAKGIGGENTSTHMVKKNNKYTGSTMAARIKENEVIMYISATNLDMTAFTPNKTFKIVFDNTTKYAKYKGQYRLTYAYHLIRVESENFSSSTHHLILKRISD